MKMRRSRWNSWSARRRRNATITNVEVAVVLALALLIVAALFVGGFALLFAVFDHFPWLAYVVVCGVLVAALVRSIVSLVRHRRRDTAGTSQPNANSSVLPARSEQPQ